MVVIPPEEASVVTPTTLSVSAILVVSSSVLPSTSTLPLTSSSVPTVAIPLTFQFLAVASS